jgi:hypothetical protein
MYAPTVDATPVESSTAALMQRCGFPKSLFHQIPNTSRKRPPRTLARLVTPRMPSIPNSRANIRPHYQNITLKLREVYDSRSVRVVPYSFVLTVIHESHTVLDLSKSSEERVR